MDSMLAKIAGWITPIFKPTGFADWRITTSLITGALAKESVVSTISVLFGTTEGIKTILTVRTALSLLVFCLLYTPCVAAIASVKRELGRKWAWGMVLMQCSIAWIVAVLIYLLGGLIGL